MAKRSAEESGEPSHATISRVRSNIHKVLTGLVVAGFALAGCGGEEPPAEIPSGKVLARATPTSAPPTDEDFRVGGPRISMSNPREISVIWDEMVERRNELGALLEESRLLALSKVAQRMVWLNDEILAAASSKLDKGASLELVRAGNFTREAIVLIQDTARSGMPGFLPFRLWEMDRGLLVIEGDLPDELLGEARYPEPAPKPPV